MCKSKQLSFRAFKILKELQNRTSVNENDSHGYLFWLFILLYTVFVKKNFKKAKKTKFELKCAKKK